MRKFEIDMKCHRPVIFESDDWGSCETVASPEMAAKYQKMLKERHGIESKSFGGLENTDRLEDLFKVLEAHKDVNGRHPIFTAFTCVGNPDYDAIRENGFTEYVDMSIYDGFPSMWKREGLMEKYREGEARGVWWGEFHSMLHHTSPKIWMELLQSGDKLARDLFDLQCFCQLKHIPEYDKYNVREQYGIIKEGFKRFEKIFGRLPACAVTSDAYPETELLWTALGVTNVCLKNCRVNTGEIVVYPTKPWNNQDVYAKIGDYNPKLDAIYLGRTVFMEPGVSAEEVIDTVRKVWERHKEPAVISTHRACYCSYDQAKNDFYLERLHTVLSALESMGAEYMTTAELGDAYRTGSMQ